MIKLSVIIPIYNTPQDLLEHCLSSIQDNLRAVGDDVEVLLFNDGSTEPYIEPILKGVEATDSHFKYIYKENSGVSETRNMGIKIAKGEYVTFVDSDDYLTSDALKFMMSIIDKHHYEIAVWGVDNEYIPMKPSVPVQMTITRNEVANIIKLMCSGEEEGFWEKGIFFDYLHGKIYRTDFLRRHQLLFNPLLKIGEDCVFILSILSYAEKIYIDNTCVYHYVYNNESVARKYSPNHMVNLPRLLKAIEEVAHHELLDDKDICHSISKRCLKGLQIVRDKYLTHPENRKPFGELKVELNTLLSNPVVRKYINLLRLSDARNKIELKNIILLKLHLYWIFLITERRKRRKQKSNQKNG